MKKLVLTLSILTIVTAMALGTYIHKKTQLMFSNLNLNSTIKIEAPNLSIQKGTFFLIGDSRVKQWREFPNNSQIQVFNFGKNGATSFEVIQKIKKINKSYMPEKILIQVGINDLKTVNFFPEYEDRIQKNLMNNIKKITKYYVDAGSKVYLTTIICPAKTFDKWFIFWRNSTNKILQNVNKQFRAMESPSINIINLDKLLGCEPNTERKFATDTLHLNKLGYRTINTKIQEIINLSALALPLNLQSYT